MKKDKIPIFNQYDTISPATKLLEKRRKMYEIHEAFESQKDDFRNQQGQFSIEEQKIKSRNNQLEEDLRKFAQFLQDNQSKRKKAEERIRLQQKTFAQKQQQIKNLQKQIEELTKSQKKYLKKVINLKKYQDFLQMVRTNYNDQYPQMNDILNRYQTLKKSNDDLIRSRENMEQQYETLKHHSMAQQKSLNQSLLTLNNQIKELSRKIQDRIHQKNELQSQVQQSNQQFSKKNLNLGKIFMAIDNLSSRCNENSWKLKYDFDQKMQEKKQSKKKQEGVKLEDEISYQQKSKYAGIKLKGIISHMKDFKSLIDEYRERTKPSKPQRGDRY